MKMGVLISSYLMDYFGVELIVVKGLGAGVLKEELLGMMSLGLGLIWLILLSE